MQDKNVPGVNWKKSDRSMANEQCVEAAPVDSAEQAELQAAVTR